MKLLIRGGGWCACLDEPRPSLLSSPSSPAVSSRPASNICLDITVVNTVIIRRQDWIKNMGGWWTKNKQKIPSYINVFFSQVFSVKKWNLGGKRTLPAQMPRFMTGCKRPYWLIQMCNCHPRQFVQEQLVNKNNWMRRRRTRKEEKQHFLVKKKKKTID